MTVSRRVQDFAKSEDGLKLKQLLIAMVDDPQYNTSTSYSANSEKYPDNKIPFVDKHMAYLSVHQSTDFSHYVANLKLITKVR